LEDIVLGTSSNPQATLASPPKEVVADESPL
jgi:hypothetical protein